MKRIRTNIDIREILENKPDAAKPEPVLTQKCVVLLRHGGFRAFIQVTGNIPGVEFLKRLTGPEE